MPCHDAENVESKLGILRSDVEDVLLFAMPLEKVTSLEIVG